MAVHVQIRLFKLVLTALESARGNEKINSTCFIVFVHIQAVMKNMLPFDLHDNSIEGTTFYSRMGCLQNYPDNTVLTFFSD